MTGEKQKLMKHVDLDEPTSFLDHVYLGCTQRECKPNAITTNGHRENVWLNNFCWSNWKIARMGITSGRGLTKRHRNCTKIQIFPWMTIISRKRNLNQLETYPMYARNLSWNVCTWYELVDQTDYGKQTNMLDLSPNGQEHVTDHWHGWSCTFITQLITDNIFMWVRRLSSADWVFSKIQILLSTLRIQNQLRRESFVFLEVEHSSPLVECFRRKRQYPNQLSIHGAVPSWFEDLAQLFPDQTHRIMENPSRGWTIFSDSVEVWDTDVCFLHIQPKSYPTLPQNQKLFRQVLDWEWTDYSLWTCEMWW